MRIDARIIAGAVFLCAPILVAAETTSGPLTSLPLSPAKSIAGVLLNLKKNPVPAVPIAAETVPKASLKLRCGQIAERSVFNLNIAGCENCRVIVILMARDLNGNLVDFIIADFSNTDENGDYSKNYGTDLPALGASVEAITKIESQELGLQGVDSCIVTRR